MSKSPKKLEKVEADLKNKYPNVKTMMIVANFFKNNRVNFYKELLQEVKHLDISSIYDMLRLAQSESN